MVCVWSVSPGLLLYFRGVIRFFYAFSFVPLGWNSDLVSGWQEGQVSFWERPVSGCLGEGGLRAHGTSWQWQHGEQCQLPLYPGAPAGVAVGASGYSSKTRRLSHLPEVRHPVSDSLGARAGQHDPRPWQTLPGALLWDLGHLLPPSHGPLGDGGVKAGPGVQTALLPLKSYSPSPSAPPTWRPGSFPDSLAVRGEVPMESILGLFDRQENCSPERVSGLPETTEQLPQPAWNSGLLTPRHTCAYVLPSSQDDTLSHKCKRDQTQPWLGLSCLNILRICRTEWFVGGDGHDSKCPDYPPGTPGEALSVEILLHHFFLLFIIPHLKSKAVRQEALVFFQLPPPGIPGALFCAWGSCRLPQFPHLRLSPCLACGIHQETHGEARALRAKGCGAKSGIIWAHCPSLNCCR